MEAVVAQKDAKIAQKNEVISKLMEENVLAKKPVGSSEKTLGEGGGHLNRRERHRPARAGVLTVCGQTLQEPVSACPGGHRAVQPPSIVIVCPVTLRAAGLTR